MLGPATTSSGEGFEQPVPTVASCSIIDISGPNAFVQCLDSLGNVIPAGQVNLPEVIKEVKVLVPGPTITIQPIPLPRPTKTVTIPGPTKTVTVIAPSDPRTIWLPGETKTKTVKVPGPVVTKTAPAQTQTVTVTETPRPTPVYAPPKVDNPQQHDVLFDPPPVTRTVVVGYSALALLIASGLIILGLWLGYIMGYKDKERVERKFLDALRDQFYYKGEHS